MSMREAEKHAVGVVTELIIETFRLNGRLLEAGDDLVAPLGLSSARWQVLGAIDAASERLPVAHIARNMGLSRQAVQRLVDEMAGDGLVAFELNPHHARAKFVVMTERGREAFRAAMAKQRRWAAALAEGVPRGTIESATRVLRTLRNRLQEA